MRYNNFWKITVIIFLGFTLFELGCVGEVSHENGDAKDDSPLTEQERGAIEKVLEFFGGYCVGSYGIVADKRSGVRRFFELNLVESPIVKQNFHIKEVIASNVALRFFAEIDSAGRERYDEIQVLFERNGDSSTRFDFSVSVLTQLEKRVPIVRDVVLHLMDKDYLTIRNMIDPNLVGFSLDTFMLNLERADMRFGAIQEFKFLGFQRVVKNNEEYIRAVGVLEREIQSHYITMLLPGDAQSDVVYLVDYTL